MTTTPKTDPRTLGNPWRTGYCDGYFNRPVNNPWANNWRTIHKALQYSFGYFDGKEAMFNLIDKERAFYGRTLTIQAPNGYKHTKQAIRTLAPVQYAVCTLRA